MSEGTIITFYSYKGGVGRTFALANIAALLSTWGYKILCIDWDLEAPGLHFYFQSRMKEQNPSGLVEFIRAYVNEKRPSWKDYTTSVSFDEADSSLLFMQAGHRDASYAQRLQSLNWETLYAEHNLGNFLEQIRNEWKESLDFIFIDSRTGITDIGGICTIQLPDLLVLPLTANEQSLSGSIDTMNRLRATQAELPLDHGNILVLPIISRFEGRVEYKQAERWLATFAQRLTPFYKEWLHRYVKVEEILNFTRIPSVPFWSFGEELPVIKKGTDDPDDIGFPLETLAALVAQKFSSTDVLIRNRDAFVNAVKNRAKEQESDVLPSASSTNKTISNTLTEVFISYAHEDEQLKKSLDKHLSILKQQGIVNAWSSKEIPVGAQWNKEINARLEAANVILLLVSPDYLASSASVREMEQALKRAKAGEARVIPIILRPVDWEGSPIIGTLHPLPSNMKPVTTWAYRDEAWADVAKGVREAVESLKKT
ncbi:MAG TPA: TIR domain-containing protein [Ktedonobacteraceae bacterium]|nr:TIR domain-containing protein [Ktedonobacteraceae bacterium]